jgi:hypothetical protein
MHAAGCITTDTAGRIFHKVVQYPQGLPRIRERASLKRHFEEQRATGREREHLESFRLRRCQDVSKLAGLPSAPLAARIDAGRGNVEGITALSACGHEMIPQVAVVPFSLNLCSNFTSSAGAMNN